MDKDHKVPDQAFITYNGVICPPIGFPRLWGFHKPINVLSTMDDKEGATTIGEMLRKSSGTEDYMPYGIPDNASIVSGLNAKHEGLILLTNNGDFASKLRDARYKIQTTYLLRCHGKLPHDNLRSLWAGATCRGVNYGPVWVEILRRSWSSAWLRVRFVETKERNLEYLFNEYDLDVKRSRRYAIGPYKAHSIDLGQSKPFEIHPALRGLATMKEKSLALMPAQSPSTHVQDSMISIFDRVGSTEPAQPQNSALLPLDDESDVLVGNEELDDDLVDEVAKLYQGSEFAQKLGETWASEGSVEGGEDLDREKWSKEGGVIGQRVEDQEGGTDTMNGNERKKQRRLIREQRMKENEQYLSRWW